MDIKKLLILSSKPWVFSKHKFFIIQVFSCKNKYWLIVLIILLVEVLIIGDLYLSLGLNLNNFFD